MATAYSVNAARDDVPPASAPACEPGLLQGVEALWGELRGLVHDHLQLAALEAQRAGESLVSIVAYGIVAGALVVSAWLGAMGALVLWLIAGGVAASVALLPAVLLNLLGAFGLAVAIRRASRPLRFPATVRSFGPAREGAAAAERP